jgi:hypothetical protein
LLSSVCGTVPDAMTIKHHDNIEERRERISKHRWNIN